MSIDEDIRETKKKKKGKLLKNPFKFFYIVVRGFFRWIRRSTYMTFLKAILKGHDKRNKIILDYIQLVKQRYDYLHDNKLLKATAKNVREIRKRENVDEKLTKELSTHRNNLIEMILKSKDVFDLTTEEGEPMSEQYLYGLDVDMLIDKTNKLYEKLKRLDA